MGRWLWWGALAGATAGLAMVVCALGLAGLGRFGCVWPYLAVSAAALPAVPQGRTITLAALAPGVALHEGVAATLGLLAAWALAPRARWLAAASWGLGGGLSMALFDAAVLALRTPGLPPLADHLRFLEYLVFGLVAAGCFLALTASGIGGSLRAIAIPGSAQGPEGRPCGGRHPGRHRFAGHSMRVRLEVVVAPHCFGCERARGLAAAVATRYPELDVRVVDLAQPDVVAPPGLIAVPAYILNGRIIFTGNPTPNALDGALSRAGAGAPTTMQGDA